MCHFLELVTSFLQRTYTLALNSNLCLVISFFLSLKKPKMKLGSLIWGSLVSLPMVLQLLKLLNFDFWSKIFAFIEEMSLIMTKEAVLSHNGLVIVQHFFLHHQEKRLLSIKSITFNSLNALLATRRKKSALLMVWQSTNEEL